MKTVAAIFLLLAASCGSDGGPGYSLLIQPETVELGIDTGSVAFVDVEVVPDGFDGSLQVGFRDTSIEGLPGGILALSPCPDSGPVDGCDVSIDTVVSIASGDLVATLGFEVTTGATLVPGSEYTVEVAAAEAGTGGRIVTASFTLLLTE